MLEIVLCHDWKHPAEEGLSAVETLSLFARRIGDMSTKRKDPTVAFLLEFVPGILAQWFGWGHIYSGNILTGLVVMMSYWVLQGLNILLMYLAIGFVTAPLTWILFLSFSPLSARKAI